MAVQAVNDICDIFQIQSLMTFGGEPLLYPEVVCRIHETARERGIPQRDLITNGFFSRDAGRIKAVAGMLAESGVRKILLSVDAFHQETIPLEPVKLFAECVKAQGILLKLSPAWLVSREDDNPYNLRTREVLREFEDLALPTGQGNVVFPSGNAKKYLGEYFKSGEIYVNPYEEDPKDVRTISFSANGDVLKGNIYRRSIREIIEAYAGEK